MCGRFFIDDEMSAEIRKILADLEDTSETGIKTTGEIFPTNTVSVLVGKQGGMNLASYTWGFPNFRNKSVIINARQETAAEKKIFRNGLINKRCIIPASGFFEWDRNKNKIYFTDPSSPVLYMAGLFADFNSENRFVILTTNANPSISNIHNRMPLILTESGLKPWLFDTSSAMELLAQTPLPLQQRGSV